MAAGPRDATSFEVRDALRETGCAMCSLTIRSVTRYLKSIAYEQVNDVDVRGELRAARGFCTVHAYQWLREARSVLGTAVMYRDILRTALDARYKKRTCPACRAQLDAEARYVDALVAVAMAEPAAVAASDGLCLRHVSAVSRHRGSDVLLSRTREVVDALVADLDEVIRKEDYRFRHEPRSDAQRSAPARAVAWAAGAEGVVNL